MSDWMELCGGGCCSPIYAGGGGCCSPIYAGSPASTKVLVKCKPKGARVPVKRRPTRWPRRTFSSRALACLGLPGRLPPSGHQSALAIRIESDRNRTKTSRSLSSPGGGSGSGGGGQLLPTPKMGEVVKDLTAGTAGGVANLVVGHPFDTIKVKLQSQPTPAPGQNPKYAGAIDAVKQTIAAEGPRGLYKGMGAPLATVAAFNALLFSVRGQMEALLREEPGVALTVKQQVIAGAGAGLAVSFLACPTELIKCRLQAQSSLAEAAAASGVALPKGPIDVARHVVRDAGAKGLFKGLVPTMGREVPGNAVMFGVYEATKQYLAGGRDTSNLGRGSQILAGGLAGAAFWLSVYPTDVVKSVIQVDDYKKPKYSGSLDAVRKIVAADGVKGLYKGFGPAMARSVPANAATFVAYEITRSALG